MKWFTIIQSLQKEEMDELRDMVWELEILSRANHQGFVNRFASKADRRHRVLNKLLSHAQETKLETKKGK